jgi:hypothetical protein
VALSKRAKWTLALLLALPGGLAAAWLIWDTSVDVRLRRRLAAIRTAGEPVTMQDLADAYPPIPDDRNAALPLAIAFSRMAEPSPDLDEVLPFLGRAELPPPGEPLPPDMLAAIRTHLAANAEALRLLHEALGLEDCRFDVNFALGYTTVAAPIASLRGAARLLRLEAIERTESGRVAEAGRSLRATLRLGRTLHRTSVLMDTLVRFGIDSAAASGIERWLARVTPPPTLLRELEDALRAEADPAILRRVCLTERCMTIDFYDRSVINPPPGVGNPALIISPRLDRYLPRAYFKADLACCLPLMNELVQAAARPYPDSVMTGMPLAAGIEDRIPRQYLFGRQHMTIWSFPFASVRTHMARLDCARVAIAAVRYRATHGAPPDILRALVPEFLDTVPQDPFNGYSILYRQLDDGFVVYTVGENGVDDRGQTELVKGRQPPDLGFRVRSPKPAP